MKIYVYKERKKADKYTKKQTNKRVEHETNIQKVNRRTRS